MSDPHWLEAHADLVALHREKSGGYGTGDDPLANFTAISALTGEPPWRYARRRALEKLARMESLESQGRVDELAEEHMDVASLMLCAEALRRRAKTGIPGRGDGHHAGAGTGGGESAGDIGAAPELCPGCGGDPDDNHFDRSLCPCRDVMHTYCNTCGWALDGCDFQRGKDGT